MLQPGHASTATYRFIAHGLLRATLESEITLSSKRAIIHQQSCIVLRFELASILLPMVMLIAVNDQVLRRHDA